jgi:hypothetical protein
MDYSADMECRYNRDSRYSCYVPLLAEPIRWLAGYFIVLLPGVVRTELVNLTSEPSNWQAHRISRLVKDTIVGQPQSGIVSSHWRKAHSSL